MHVEDRLTELEAKATPGPWKLLHEERHGHTIVGGGFHLATVPAESHLGYPDKTHADLIVALRNAAPVLLAVVRAARVIEHWQLDFTLDGSGRVPVDYHFLNALLTAVRELDETDVGELPEVEDL